MGVGVPVEDYAWYPTRNSVSLAETGTNGLQFWGKQDLTQNLSQITRVAMLGWYSLINPFISRNVQINSDALK